jgi:anti-sigma factor RsiW
MDANLIELVCREIVELVTEYLGGTLSVQDRTRFDEHLATCPPCTAYLAQVRTTLDLAAELGTAGDPPDADVERRLDQMFRDWHAQKKR